MPQLYREANGKVDEAILDVYVRAPAALTAAPVDFTIRCPHAQRYDMSQPGRAAADGEIEKLERYGSEVCHLSFETYGRLGTASVALLQWLASQLAQCKGGRGLSPHKVYARLRFELETVLLHEIADVTLLSLGHQSGAHSFKARSRGRCN